MGHPVEQLGLGAVAVRPRAVAANTSTEARLNTSLGGPTGWPMAVSGDM